MTMREEFWAWVNDQGCDTDGAWSAWQAASAGKAEQLRMLRERLESMKFHPDASHVHPEYRDGYNHALRCVLDLLGAQ